MHVQFAYAAISRATDGEASIGEAAHAARPARGATVEGNRLAACFAPISASCSIALQSERGRQGSAITLHCVGSAVRDYMKH